MNVDELLNYQPSNSVEDDDRENVQSMRRVKKMKTNELESDLNDARASTIDEMTVKRLLLSFERKVLKNQELRIKFNDNATKFMDSEMELFDTIQEMNVLSTQSEFYSTIVELNIIPTLLGLLSHENTDISCAIVALLQELTDLDTVDEINDVTVLFDALINGQIITQLVANIERLDETVKEESEGVYNSLAIIENLSDYKPELTNDAHTLIVWILKRFKAKLPFDGNKLYSSEILSILLQNNDDNKKLLGQNDGIDTLLQQLAYFKRHDPGTADEHEYMENIFDCLCSSLLYCPSNRELFFKGEGIELMNLILREKRKKGTNSSVRIGALKVINHALSNDKSNDSMIDLCCNKFVDILGLRVLMPILMKPSSIIGNRKKDTGNSVDEVEEHSLSIVLALLKNCKTENTKRVLMKFSELDFEKTDRLIELHFKYSEKLIKCDSQIKKERALKTINDETINEDEFFMRRLTDGGLFTLQIIDHIILLICSLYNDYNKTAEMNEQSSASSSSLNKSETIKSRIMKLINLHAATSVNHYKFIKNILKNLLNDKDDDEKQKLLELIEEF